jgi:hypothetical protein
MLANLAADAAGSSRVVSNALKKRTSELRALLVDLLGPLAARRGVPSAFRRRDRQQRGREGPVAGVCFLTRAESGSMVLNSASPWLSALASTFGALSINGASIGTSAAW